jgi:hypothetical protein
MKCLLGEKARLRRTYVFHEFYGSKKRFKSAGKYRLRHPCLRSVLLPSVGVAKTAEGGMFAPSVVEEYPKLILVVWFLPRRYAALLTSKTDFPRSGKETPLFDEPATRGRSSAFHVLRSFFP